MKIIKAEFLKRRILDANFLYKEEKEKIINIIDEQPDVVDQETINARWISPQKMPDEYDTTFKKFYGTPTWRVYMWQRQSAECIVTVELEDGTKCVTSARTYDGHWKKDGRSLETKEKRVVAWMPMPPPYSN